MKKVLDKLASEMQYSKSLAAERDTLKERVAVLEGALREVDGITDKRFTMHQEHNADLFEFRDEIDEAIDKVRLHFITKSQEHRGEGE
jgi:hypothetical protein